MDTDKRERDSESCTGKLKHWHNLPNPCLSVSIRGLFHLAVIASYSQARA
jgi:hypothetical protein